jgi:hypothetical protein
MYVMRLNKKSCQLLVWNVIKIGIELNAYYTSMQDQQNNGRKTSIQDRIQGCRAMGSKFFPFKQI